MEFTQLSSTTKEKAIAIISTTTQMAAPPKELKLNKASLVRHDNDFLVQFHVNYRYGNITPQTILFSFTDKFHCP